MGQVEARVRALVEFEKQPKPRADKNVDGGHNALMQWAGPTSDLGLTFNTRYPPGYRYRVPGIGRVIRVPGTRVLGTLQVPVPGNLGLKHFYIFKNMVILYLHV